MRRLDLRGVDGIVHCSAETCPRHGTKDAKTTKSTKEEHEERSTKKDHEQRPRRKTRERNNRARLRPEAGVRPTRQRDPPFFAFFAFFLSFVSFVNFVRCRRPVRRAGNS